MSDFNPVVLFFIVKETLAELFWPLSIVGLLLLAGVVVTAFRVHVHGRFARDAALSALVLIVAAAGLVPFVPMWSGVEMSAFSNWLDLVFAFAFALVPAAALAAIVFIGTGLRRDKR